VGLYSHDVDHHCRNPSLGLATKAKVYKGVGQKGSLGVTSHVPGSVGEWGNEPSHSQVNSHFRSWGPNGLLNLQRAMTGIKTHWIEMFLISMEIFWNLNVQNGLAWPIWTFNTQVIAKRRARNQIGSLTLVH